MDTVMTVSREDGVKDLPLKAKAKFSKALLAERDASHTTPVALSFLDEAVLAEAEYNSK